MKEPSIGEVIRMSDSDDSMYTNESVDLAGCINTLAVEIVRLRARVDQLEKLCEFTIE